MDWKRAVRETGALIKNNAPTLLTGIGLGGLVATAFLSGKASLEADKKIKELEEQNGAPLNTFEKIKAVYPYYIPAVAAGLATGGCIVGANRLSVQQVAAITTIAKTTEANLVDNRNAIKEVFGDKGLRKIDEKVNENHAAQYFASTNTIYETGKGSSLCCEGFLTGILFRANREWVHKCVNDFNARLLDGEQLCYNDFIMMLIPSIDISILPASGWYWVFNLDIRKRLMEIVEDSFLTYDSSEPGYIFKLRELPVLITDKYEACY